MSKCLMSSIPRVHYLFALYQPSKQFILNIRTTYTFWIPIFHQFVLLFPFRLPTALWEMQCMSVWLTMAPNWVLLAGRSHWLPGNESKKVELIWIERKKNQIDRCKKERPGDLERLRIKIPHTIQVRFTTLKWQQRQCSRFLSSTYNTSFFINFYRCCILLL